MQTWISAMWMLNMNYSDSTCLQEKHKLQLLKYVVDLFLMTSVSEEKQMCFIGSYDPVLIRFKFEIWYLIRIWFDLWFKNSIWLNPGSD